MPIQLETSPPANTNLLTNVFPGYGTSEGPWPGSVVPTWDQIVYTGSPLFSSGYRYGSDNFGNTLILNTDKYYRFSVWVRRNTDVNSDSVFSMFAFTQNSYTVRNLIPVYNATEQGAGGYFGSVYLNNLIKDKWYLIVGHIYQYRPFTTSFGSNKSSDIDSGIYTTTGKVSELLRSLDQGRGTSGLLHPTDRYAYDMRFFSSLTTSVGITFGRILYANGNYPCNISTYDPRVEVVDGTELPLSRRLAGPIDQAVYVNKDYNLLTPNKWDIAKQVIGVMVPSPVSSSGFRTIEATTTEDTLEHGKDPWGNSTTIWVTKPNVTKQHDGGWQTVPKPIDNTKLYRFSVWVKKTRVTDPYAGEVHGQFYFGMFGNNYGPVKSLSSGATIANPYFSAVGTVEKLERDTWYLVVGHIYPHTWSGTSKHPDSGWYSITKGKVYNNINDTATPSIENDAKWMPDSSEAMHLVYHYAEPASGNTLNFYDPRIEVCDGSQPSIQELLTKPTGNYVGYDYKKVVDDKNLLPPPIQYTPARNIDIKIANGVSGSITGTASGSFLAGKYGSKIVAPDPLGKDSLVYVGVQFCTVIPVDITKPYRLSFWLRKDPTDPFNRNIGAQVTIFLSLNGSIVTGPTQVATLSSSAAMHYGTITDATAGVWYYVVGHVFPYNSIARTQQHPDTGLYNYKASNRFLKLRTNIDSSTTSTTDLIWPDYTTSTQLTATIIIYGGDAASNVTQIWGTRFEQYDINSPPVFQLTTLPPSTKLEQGLVIYDVNGTLRYTSEDVTWNQVDFFRLEANSTVTKTYSVLQGKSVQVSQVMIDRPPADRRATAYTYTRPDETTITFSGGNVAVYLLVLMK